MSLCKVCGRELAEKNRYLCGFCHFNPPYVLNGNAEEALRENVLSEKRNLLQKVRAAVKVFDYDAAGAAFSESGEEYLFFPELSAFDTVYWLDEQFLTVNTREEFPVQLSVRCNGHLMELSVPVRNIREAKYLCVGISVDTDFNAAVVLTDPEHRDRNERSQKAYLFANRS